MKKLKVDYFMTVLGVLLLGIGLYLIKSIENPQGFMRAFPYVCVGLGCGVFGQGVGSIISKKAIQTDSKLEKQIEIEKKEILSLHRSRKPKRMI